MLAKYIECEAKCGAFVFIFSFQEFFNFWHNFLKSCHKLMPVMRLVSLFMRIYFFSFLLLKLCKSQGKNEMLLNSFDSIFYAKILQKHQN